MWFRNLQFYRFVQKFPYSEQELRDKLSEFAFQPCAKSAEESSGWVSPNSMVSDELLYVANGCFMFNLRKEQKVIPASMVNEAVEEKARDIQLSQGRKVFRKEKQQFKEEIIALLLPKAFVRSTHTLGYIDIKNQFLVINASSPSAAEHFVKFLLDTLGTLGAARIQSKDNPGLLMNNWLKGELPDNWSLTGEVELKDFQDERVARFKGNEQHHDVYDELIDDGYWVNKLGLNYDDKLTTVIHGDLQCKSVKFSDQLIKDNDVSDIDDESAKWDADFVLMNQLIAEFYSTICQIFEVDTELEKGVE